MSLTTEQIDKIISELNDIAREYGDGYDFGLPIYNVEYVQKMRSTIMQIATEPVQDINEIIEARKKQFEELKK